MSQKKISMIGLGFVGQAMLHCFKYSFDIKVYDKYKAGICLDSLHDTVLHSKFIFVAVPTPMRDDGSQDLTNIQDVIESINFAAGQKRRTIIIRSTVLPMTTRMLAGQYPNHDFVFYPEFLTERCARLDYINQARIILGDGNPDIGHEVYDYVFKDFFSNVPFFNCIWEAAELVKYMNNTFFSVKISFLNEFYDIIKDLGLNYQDVKNMWLADGRIGNSHSDVPGHDGDRGFGGKCFPKDLNALIKWAEERGEFLDMLRAALEVNKRVRTYQDWKEIKGATSTNNY